MARKLRIQEEGMLYHVMAIGNSKNNIFLTERDRDDLFFIIGGDQGIESYMDIIHNFSKQEENFVEKAYLASNKIEEKLDDLFFETLKLKKKKLSLEEIEDKIQECISKKGIEVKRSDYKKYLYHLLINMG